MSTDLRRGIVAILATLAFGGSFLIAGASHAFRPTISVASPNVGVCDNSAGNVDGSACNWQDVDTGRWHASDSSDYRQKQSKHRY